MTATFLSLQSLRPALVANALVLVPNNRLRNHLLRAFALQQTASAWLKPNIQSLSQWLEMQWETLQNKGVDYTCVSIASPLQRQMLWEAAIKHSPQGANLLQPKPLAQQADSALKNLELWCVLDSVGSDGFIDPNSNCGQFTQWMTTFSRALALQKAITREASYRLIAQAFACGDLPKLDKIYLEGFDDLPPLMQMILEAAADHLIHLPQQTAVQTTLIRTQAGTTAEEIRAAALWSRQQLTAQPDTALIGIVVPNLGQCRDQVERIFSEVFEAHSLLPHTQRYTLPFNFSAGTPLGSTPLIHSLFEILRLQDNRWPLQRLCNLLDSPFWGDEPREAAARAQLILQLRKLGRLELSSGDLRHCASKMETRFPEFAAAGLSSRFEALGNLLRRRLENKSAREWLAVFTQILQTMNWPGARRLDSQEYQQLLQWFEVCDEFASIDHHSAPISYNQACRYLRELADKTPFQAQTPDSPIQILGALEAAGLQFSHLWVMHLSDNQWPPVPAPNPLLPLHLQRERQMPHASATRELEIAEGLTQRYRQSAQQVIFSSAHGDGDSELRPSALIREIPLTDLDNILGTLTSELQDHYQTLQSSGRREVVLDNSGPPLAGDEPVRGGSSLFKYQAACPFEAFVRLRLGARNPDEPVLGFNAAERGNLLHEALAAIWRELKDSSGLAAQTESELKNLVDTICEQILSSAHSRNPRKLGRVYCQLEQHRLAQLLCEWLAGERERPAFSVVAIEQEQQIAFAGLNLRLRIDRLDKFSNGDLLLIDYKTGNASAKSWQGERLAEPQLPLYSVTREDIAAISFAQINRKAQKWEGLGELHDSSLSQPGIKPADSWPAQLQEWQAQLQKLADDFIAGDARIDFRDSTSESQASDLAPLTRMADVEALYQFAAQAHGGNH
ncbi:MAG TPA: PD-(D/E)XK nuclease family protein [Cellvibrio sp.]|nr:PD-(D/E)XK nuclease family protein [Cellvibrio sp.]